MAMRLLTAPNLMSASRLVLAAIFPLIQPQWRLTLVIIAAITDCLDGVLARRLQLQTVSGQVLDPIGDKVFAIAVLLTMCFDGEVEWWQLAPILSRDLVAAIAGATLARRSRWEAGALLIAAPLGKIATVFEYVWFASILTTVAVPTRMPLFALTAATCVLAAVQYAARLVKAIREDSQRETSPDR